jgi:class 3 adenylate cyclase
MEKLNQKYKLPEIKLKLGIHFGPVLAVTMNEKLDYFGTTVNLAARTQDKSLGGDIVVTENFFNLDEIQKEIQKNKLSYEKFTVELKGFSESYSLVRIYP